MGGQPTVSGAPIRTDKLGRQLSRRQPLPLLPSLLGLRRQVGLRQPQQLLHSSSSSRAQGERWGGKKGQALDGSFEPSTRRGYHACSARAPNGSAPRPSPRPPGFRCPAQPPAAPPAAAASPWAPPQPPAPAWRAPCGRWPQTRRAHRWQQRGAPRARGTAGGTEAALSPAARWTARQALGRLAGLLARGRAKGAAPYI